MTLMLVYDALYSDMQLGVVSFIVVCKYSVCIFVFAISTIKYIHVNLMMFHCFIGILFFFYFFTNTCSQNLVFVSTINIFLTINLTYIHYLIGILFFSTFFLETPQFY